jgi:hypothetical protein
MHTYSISRPRRPRVLFVLLSLALSGMLLTPRSAHAQLVGCQSDPILVLSNKTEIDLRASIDDSSDDVRQVTYTVHGPAHTSVIAVIPGLLGPKEVVQYSADQATHSYVTTTLVDTGADGVAVTASTQALALGLTILPGLGLDTGVALVSISGLSHQPLSLSLTL